jgi:hypothetical protein
MIKSNKNGWQRKAASRFACPRIAACRGRNLGLGVNREKSWVVGLKRAIFSLHQTGVSC